jgi:hypothetical protein
MNDAHVRSKGETAIDCKQAVLERKLPLRDWITLLILALLTICVVAVSTESIARRMFPEPKSPLRSCLIENDVSTGVRGIPNSVCSEQSIESGLVEYRFNGCGYRAGLEWGPKPPGAYRIVMVGTSTAFGTGVPREKSIAALLPVELSRRTGRNVELYNEALPGGTARAIVLRFNAILAAKPDMILWILTPWDIRNAPSLLFPPPASNSGGFLAKVRKQVKDSASRILIEHFLYQSASSYLSLFLKDARGPGFLGATLSTEWQRHLRDYETYATNIEGQASAASIPVVAVLVPDRAQAAMISTGDWPAAYNPYELDNELRPIVTRHGGTYIDILPDFRSIPNPEKYYFPVDGHPNADGHRIVSGLLANALTAGAVPALKVAAQPKTAQEQGR